MPRRGAALLRPAGFDELGLRRALAGWMLPFLVAAMAVLAALAMGGVVGASTLARQWRIGPAAVLTVQVPRPAELASAGTGPAGETRITNGTGETRITNGAGETRVDRALALLRATPGVALARPLPEQELMDLLRPWLSGDADRMALPLPGVVELRLADGASLPPDLARRLGAAVPGSLVENHGPWLRRLSTLARSLLACALAALALVVGIAVVVVGVATRAGLSARREAIEIVHGLGATDAYIAGKFAARITWMAMAGGLIGALLALPVLAGLAWLATPFMSATGDISGDITGEISVLSALPRALWGLLPGLPIVAGLIGWLTAQTTVRRWLRQLP